MQNIAVLFFEPGMPESIPGLLKNYPSMHFPFWGHFTFLDFHIANFNHQSGFRLFFILQDFQKNLLIKLSSLIKKEMAEICILENGVYSLIDYINNMKVDLLIISSLAFIGLMEVDFFQDFQTREPNDIIKISLDKIPLEMYFLKRKTIIALLKSNLNQYTEKMNILDYLFSKILQNSFDSIVDISGKLFFHNNLQQLFQNNLWLIRNQSSREFAKVFYQAPFRDKNIQNSYIGPNGYIKNSFISSGVEIHGLIEDSIIFSNVSIMENSIIKNSVIMNNNRIGKNCQIFNTIIFPYFDEMQNNYYNIKDNLRSGGKVSNIKNDEFPEQINNGLIAIGSNANLTNNLNIEPGSYLEPGISEKELRKIDKIKKGTTVKTNEL